MTNEQLREAILAQNPTAEQEAAIFAEEHEFLLRAAPGSGKTWTSCRRFIWRGANWHHRVGGLTLLSFTNAAIREFKRATTEVGRGELLSDPNYVGTFDSFVERFIISPFGHLTSEVTKRPRLFTGPRPGYRNNAQLKVWIDGKDGGKRPVYAWEIVPYIENKRVCYCKQGVQGSTDLPREAAAAAVLALLKLGFYTHDQRVFWACKLLCNRPHLAELLARRFPEIIVDEAQDCNVWLLHLLNYLRERGSMILLVGDPDQCIYEFAMADATSLSKLKEKWGIDEKPLSQSFRCHNPIAKAVRNIGRNTAFLGCGEAQMSIHKPYIIKEGKDGPAGRVQKFLELLDQAEIQPNLAAVVCRGHSQLEAIRGKCGYNGLQGKTKELAVATFQRDSRRDYRSAYQTVRRVVRELSGDDDIWAAIDEDPEGRVAHGASLAIWRFVKDSDRLPPVSRIGSDWIAKLRSGLTDLLVELGITQRVRIGNNIKATGLSDEQMTLPLFDALESVPVIRQDTIHQVKGESIDAVMVVGNAKFWNSVITAIQAGDSTEERRLAYVAMTRARHLLLVSLPSNHFNTHAGTWQSWGFQVLE